MTRYYTPNHAQMLAAVKGNDPRHRIKIRRKPYWLIQFGYALMALFLLVAVFVSLFIIAEFLK